MPLTERLQRAAQALWRAASSRPALLTLAFSALYLATYDSDMGSPDETIRFGLSESIARRGLSALWGSGPMSKYPPLQSIVGGLLMKAGIALDGGATGTWAARLALSVSLLATLALVPLFYWAARTLDLPERRAALAAALFGLTNPLWPYSKRFFSEPLTAALALGAFAGGLAFVRKGSRKALAAGLACLLVLPLQNLILPIAVGLALGAMLLFSRRFKALAALAATSGLAAGLLFLSLYVRFRRPGALGYGGESFKWELAHVLDGFHGLLLGPGRSVFLFAPLLVLAVLGGRELWRRSRPAALGSLAAFLAALVVVSSWWCWWGGICWGPRLMLPALPIASLGAATFLAEPRRWKAALAALVALFGLYVQAMGFSFKHDFDIYFWMNGSYEEERKAWFQWEYSALRRMPRHFREHPWDLSSAFLTLEPRGPSVVELGREPVRQVEIAHRGDAIVFNWSVSDVWAVVAQGDSTRRIPAAELGATLASFNRQPGEGALDGNPATRWATGRKRLDGDWIRLDFPEERSDLVRLELEHLPFDKDFPNGLSAKVRGASGPWRDAPARAATPRLRWNPLIAVLAALGLGLLALSLRRGRPQPAACPAASPSP